MSNVDVTEMLSTCSTLIPKDLIIDSVKWKGLIWAALRGRNALLVGPSRCGKTKSAQCLAKALNRPFFYFNLGSTQDARATLIGNTTYKKDQGTVFNPSQFVTAIQTPNSIILLDELSRGHHDAWNILMPVLDSTQRYLRLDETSDSSIIKVEESVMFVSTANIGNEFTATKVIDAALQRRFPVIIEIDALNFEQEMNLLKVTFEGDFDKFKKPFECICRISDDTKKQSAMDDAKISTFIPTGTVIEMAQMVIDEFLLKEIAELVILPLYDKEGGTDSERLYIKQIIQKYLDVDSAGVASPITDPTKTGKKTRLPF